MVPKIESQDLPMGDVFCAKAGRRPSFFQIPVPRRPNTLWEGQEWRRVTLEYEWGNASHLFCSKWISVTPGSKPQRQGGPLRQPLLQVRIQFVFLLCHLLVFISSLTTSFVCSRRHLPKWAGWNPLRGQHGTVTIFPGESGGICTWDGLPNTDLSPFPRPRLTLSNTGR